VEQEPYPVALLPRQEAVACHAVSARSLGTAGVAAVPSALLTQACLRKWCQLQPLHPRREWVVLVVPTAAPGLLDTRTQAVVAAPVALVLALLHRLETSVALASKHLACSPTPTPQRRASVAVAPEARSTAAQEVTA
jgi:hypothetical protein